jgi:hypothetical protein
MQHLEGSGTPVLYDKHKQILYYSLTLHNRGDIYEFPSCAAQVLRKGKCP